MHTGSSRALAAVAIVVCGVAAAQPSITVAELGAASEPTDASASLDGSAPLDTTAAPSDVAADAALTRADLEAWLDGFLPYALRQGDVAGGVIVVVRDGEVLLQKGYGLADVEKRTPVDPQRTLFRLGSVAKLFTWTAVMQLVEEGKLDLDRDINAYLDFAIPRTFAQPITLRHVMTHTPGFEEMLKRLISADPRQFLPLEAYVKAQMPARIYPPGTVPAYSNYATTLAGYIVQRVSGESFDDYVERHVLGPLEMSSSTFRQPLPARFAAQMSRGYLAASDPARYFELVGPAPAGALAASGADMARFMIAYLQVRSGAAPELLQPQTARLMQETMFRAVPPGNGMALGFFERSRNGRRIIGHAGDTQFFHSDLLLFIDDGVGLFMSFNSTGREGSAYRIRDALLERFADRYFPAPLPQEPALASAPVDASVSGGRYQSSRRADTSFLAVLSVLGQATIAANPDGALVIPPVTGLNGKPKVWRKVDSLVWREDGGRERLVARVVDGRVQMLGLDSSGGIAMLMPVPAWKSSAWIVPVLLASIAMLLFTALSWPVVALVRRHYGAAATLTGRPALLHRLSRVTALVLLAFLVGWLVLLHAAQSDYSLGAGAIDPWLAMLHFVGMIGIVGTGVALWNAWITWRSEARWGRRVSSLLLAIACVAITWFAVTFNLIRFTLDY